MKKTVMSCLFALMCSPCIAAPLGAGSFDMISISADEAREDEQPGILHFNGHFLMQSHDWNLTSEVATVYGSPDKPDRVILEGSPARFMVEGSDIVTGQINAAALVVEYSRDANVLVLSGDATLMLGDELIRSNHIEYDIGANRYKAGGADGVLIEVPPIE